jgi:hypothetical protein
MSAPDRKAFGFGQARIAIAAMACSQLKLWNAATIASANTIAPIKGWAADSSLARRLARFRLHDGGAGIGVRLSTWAPLGTPSPFMRPSNRNGFVALGLVPAGEGDFPDGAS